MSRDARPSAWRQPMVWLVTAIPLMSVAATVALIAVAGGPGATDDIAEQVHRTAQVQVADLSADARARTLGLRMRVERDVHGLHVQLLSGSLDARAPLQLALRHPTLAARDHVLDLVPDGTGWRADPAIDLGHDWNLQLEPRDCGWRLQGRWRARDGIAVLQPAMGAVQ
jgi:hypothetical protein